MSLSYGKYTSEIKSGVIFDNDSFIPEIQSEESHSLFFLRKTAAYPFST